MRATLRYVDEWTLDVSDTTTIGGFAIRANSLYDPVYATGVSHQPRGFDQYMQLYSVYTVLGSKINVQFFYAGYQAPAVADATLGNLIQAQNNAGAITTTGIPAQKPILCGINKALTAIGSTDTAIQNMEKDKTVSRNLTPTGNGSVTVYSSMRVSDFYGKSALVGADGYTGTDSTNPDQEVLYNCWAGNAAGASQKGGSGVKTLVRAIVTIEYDAVFTEPKILVES